MAEIPSLRHKNILRFLLGVVTLSRNWLSNTLSTRNLHKIA